MNTKVWYLSYFKGVCLPYTRMHVWWYGSYYDKERRSSETNDKEKERWNNKNVRQVRHEKNTT